MRRFMIRLENINYRVEQTEECYSIFENGEEILCLKPEIDRHLNYKWHCLRGNQNHLVAKIGQIIEHFNLSKYF